MLIRHFLKPLRPKSLHTCLVAYSTTDDPNGQPSLKNKRLFRTLRVKQVDLIEKERAMAEFNLTEYDLRDLPFDEDSNSTSKLYFREMVEKRAKKIYGSGEGIIESRERVNNPFPKNESYQNNEEYEDRPRGSSKKSKAIQGGNWAVIVATGTNVVDMCSKFAGYYFTGSQSLFSEGMHSACDTVNSLLLLLGTRLSERKPDNLYPYGTGNLRYMSSMSAGVALFFLGGAYSMYNGYVACFNPSELELSYAPIFLCISFLLQGGSAINAYREAFKILPKEFSFTQKVRAAFKIDDPAHRVVLMEDSAAILGFFIATAGVTSSMYLQSPLPDAIGSLTIGFMLCCLAVSIVQSNMRQLLGRSVPQEKKDAIRQTLMNDRAVKSVHDVKATIVSAGVVRFKGEVDWEGRVITKDYLDQQCNLEEMFNEVKNMENIKQFEEFMLYHGDQIVERVGDETNRVEKVVEESHPDVKYIDLETN